MTIDQYKFKLRSIAKEEYDGKYTRAAGCFRWSLLLAEIGKGYHEWYFSNERRHLRRECDTGKTDEGVTPEEILYYDEALEVLNTI